MSQGKVEEAIAMRHGLHQYEEALTLGRAHRLPEERLESMAQDYFRLLVDTKQEERAAALKEKEVCVSVGGVGGVVTFERYRRRKMGESMEQRFARQSCGARASWNTP